MLLIMNYFLIIIFCFFFFFLLVIQFRRLCNGDSRHFLASAGVESNASAQAEPAAHREMANMEIRY